VAKYKIAFMDSCVCRAAFIQRKRERKKKKQENHMCANECHKKVHP
jgi:hypothetical protein